MANTNNEKTNLGPDQQRQRTGQAGNAGDPNKPQKQGGPTTVNNPGKDIDNPKMPADKQRQGQDVDQRDPQRQPQGQPNRSDMNPGE